MLPGFMTGSWISSTPAVQVNRRPCLRASFGTRHCARRTEKQWFTNGLKDIVMVLASREKVAIGKRQQWLPQSAIRGVAAAYERASTE
jgi:hypothetical protein